MIDDNIYVDYLSIDKEINNNYFNYKRHDVKTSVQIDFEIRRKCELRTRKSIIKFLDRMINKLDIYICSNDYLELYRGCLINSKYYLQMMNNKFLLKLSYSIFGSHNSFMLSDEDYDCVLFSKGDCYNFILYTMLYASHVQSLNYGNFKAIVDDISGFTYLARDWFTYEYELESEEMKRNKNLIEHIVSDKNYKDNQQLRETLILILKRCMAVKERKEEDFLWRLNQLYEDIDSLGDRALSRIDINGIFEEFFKTGQYCKLLLYGNRYDYLKKVEIEDNTNIKNQIYSNIMTLSYDMFSALNSDCSCDSFIRCMDMVFDSDSYNELFSKLNLLKDASKLYDSGQKNQALFLVKKINSLEHKEIFCGEVVSYSHCMNEVKKPKRIIDRMKELYSKIDSSISYDYMDKIHAEATALESMETEILEQRKNPMNKIKRYIKRMKFWKGQ